MGQFNIDNGYEESKGVIHIKGLPIDYRIDILTADKLFGAEKKVRVIYIIEGNCTAGTGADRLQLGKTDILLLNSGETCVLSIDKGSLAASVVLDYYDLCSILETASISFYVNSAEDAGQKYTELKIHMQRLLLAYASGRRSDRILEQGMLLILLEKLVKSFTKPVQIGEQGDNDTSSQIAQIIQYIHANFKINMSLNEIAERLYISPSWASRVFRKETGEHFASYVKNLRLDHAREELEHTDHSITRIAVDNGFSTPSALNRIFRDKYDITPTEYREKTAKAVRQEEKILTENKERVLRILDADRQLSIAEQENQISLQADVSQMETWDKWENRVLNVGPAHQLSSANLQKQVLFLANRLDVEYLRLWNIFSPKMMIVSDDRRADYNFSFIDEVLDFCVDNKLKVFIDLAQRKDVALASEKQEIFSYKGFTEFESEAAWLDALKNFLVHIRRRYHGNVVGNWVFELSFSLNDKPYFISEQYSNEEVWKRGYELIREIIPMARIAGPGLVSGTDKTSIVNNIREFLSFEHKPDIFTSIHFPYTVEGTAASNSIYQMNYKKTASRDYLQEEIVLIKEELDNIGFEGEFWVTDWGNSLANRNYVQDSCFRAAYIAENVLKIHEYADAMGIFYASDLINLFSDSRAVLSGSAGLLSRNGIAKPAYYIYRFLNRLGRYRILQTDNCIITAEHSGDIRILCFNYKALGPSYYLMEENSHRPDELDQLLVDLDPSCLEIDINFPEEEKIFVIRQKILNREKGSILDKWIGFDCSDKLSRSDMEYLERSSVPEIIAERMIPINRNIHISVKMQPNEIRLITITRE